MLICFASLKEFARGATDKHLARGAFGKRGSAEQMAIVLYEQSSSQRPGYGWVGCNESEVRGGGGGGAHVQRKEGKEEI